jgi:hypothetical protein
MKQKIMVGGMWKSKTASLIAAREEGERGWGRLGQDTSFKGTSNPLMK